MPQGDISKKAEFSTQKWLQKSWNVKSGVALYQKFMSPEVHYLCGQGWYYATLLLIGMHWQVVLDCMHMHACRCTKVAIMNIYISSQIKLNMSKPTLNSQMVYWPGNTFLSNSTHYKLMWNKLMWIVQTAFMPINTCNCDLSVATDH